MRRLLRIFGLSVLLLAMVAGVLFYLSGRKGSGGIERWIGSQLQDIANFHLQPRLQFRDLDYQYPLTVTLKDLTLEADNPAHGGKITIISVSAATLTLAELPREGQPIVIERISLQDPVFRLVAITPNSPRLVGFSQLLREHVEQTPSPATTQASTAPASGPVDTKPRRQFSDSFRMRQIEFINGRVIYDPRDASAEPMELDQITTRLDIEPASNDAYVLKCRVAREPVFELSLNGSLDINTFHASNARVVLKADLTADKRNYLPPQLQNLLRRYDASGSLGISVTGSLPITRPLAGDLAAQLTLSQANVEVSRYRVPVEDLVLDANLKDATLAIRSLKVRALDGEGSLSGTMSLQPPHESSVKLDIAGMRMQALLGSKPDAEPTQLAGKVDAQLQAAAPIDVVMAKWNAPSSQQPNPLTSHPLPSTWGYAKIRIDEGRLNFFPVLREINASLHSVTKLMGAGDHPRDRLALDCVFDEDRAEITDFTFASDTVAARGRGTFWLDHKLDLTLNGGPLEKVQSELGEFGKIVGAVTDTIASYRVTGTLENVKVAVEFGAPALRAVEGVGRGIGRGIDKLLGKE